MPDTPRPAWLFVPALILLVPAGMALLGGFDGLYGQDAYYYYRYASGPLRDGLLALRLYSLPPFFWPPGYPLLLAALSLPLGASPVAGQLVSLVMGAAAAVFTGLLAAEIGPAAGRAAALETDEAPGLPMAPQAGPSTGHRAPGQPPGTYDGARAEGRGPGQPPAAQAGPSAGRRESGQPPGMYDGAPPGHHELGQPMAAQAGPSAGRREFGQPSAAQAGPSAGHREPVQPHGVHAVASARHHGLRWRGFLPLAAGLLAASTGQLWQSSIVVMADTSGLAGAALGMWALARYGRRGGARWLLLAAAALAFAMLSRWIYGLLALPAAAYVLWILTAGPDRGWKRAGLHAAGALAVALLVLSPMLASAAPRLAGGQQAATGFAGSFDVYRWNPANALRREFMTTDGRLSYRLPNGLYYALSPAHRYYFTPLMAVCILPGLAALRRHPRRPAAWLLAAGWAAVVFVFHAGAAWQNFRFTLAYLPPMAILAAIGLDAVTLRWPARPHPRLAAVVLAVGLLAMAAGGTHLTRGYITRKHDDLQIVRAVETQLPSGARLLAFGLTSTLRHYSPGLDVLELYDFPPQALPNALQGPTHVYLLANVASLETQWHDEPLGASYRLLRDRYGLQVLDSPMPYTLFRVGTP
jgi:4-amino-4-deoxy-L-arabinose transferase-like glycosyltransferase